MASITEIVYRISLAGLLHDIGKLTQPGGLEVSPAYEQNNIDLFCPFSSKKNTHTHKHALFTAAFLEDQHIAPIFSASLLGAGKEDGLVRLAAAHHKPGSALEAIVTVADRLSSAADRAQNPDNLIDFRKYRETRLLSPFNELLISEGNPEKGREYSYALNSTSIFPVEKSAVTPSSVDHAKEEYKDLYSRFYEDARSLSEIDDDVRLLECWDGLLRRYLSFVPAARAGANVPDVSLYDHSKAVAMLSSALYLYHQRTNTLEQSRITQSSSEEKFTLVQGEFYGIQDFIFEGSLNSEAQKSRAKLLRGRSLFVSILTEHIARLCCAEIGLTPLSIIYCSAGQFKILAPCTEETMAAITKIQALLNNWFYENLYLDASFGLSTVSFSEASFSRQKGAYRELLEKSRKASLAKKFQRFELSEFAGEVSGYAERVTDTRLCRACERRPVSASDLCSLCDDLIRLGQQAVKNNILYLSDSKFSNCSATNLPGGHFFAINDVRGGGTAISISAETYDPKLPQRNLVGYVPKDISGSVCSFEEIENAAEGVNALGILKLDVDNLGKLFAQGFPDDQLCLSLTCFLGRLFDSFFGSHLPELLAKDYPSVYTVFAGGDDLLLIGPWDKIIDLNFVLKAQFQKFVAYNEDVHFSAGISLQQAKLPIKSFVDAAAGGLEAAKNAGKNRLNIFDTNISYHSLENLKEIQNYFECLAETLDHGEFSNSLLYALTHYVEMAEQESKLAKKSTIDKSDLSSCLWRSHLEYAIHRKIGADQHTKNETSSKLVDYISNHRREIRLPLWTTLYKRRVN